MYKVPTIERLLGFRQVCQVSGCNLFVLVEHVGLRLVVFSAFIGEAVLCKRSQHSLDFLAVDHVVEGKVAFTGDDEIIHLVGVGRGFPVERLSSGDFLKGFTKVFLSVRL